jgi:tetratricopeptide (TPR) repeat protein
MAGAVRDVLAPATVIILLIAVIVMAARSLPWVGFLGAWFFVILAPTSSIIPIRDAIYEHRMYLPLAAPVVAIVISAHAILRRIFDQFQPRSSVQLFVPTGLTLCVAVALGLMTAKRNEVYTSDISTWADVASQSPHNARAHYNLGNSLRRADRREEAVEAYRDAIIADPTHVNAHHMLGTTFSELRLHDEAAEQYRQALTLDPGFVPARMNLARNLQRRGLPDAAIAELRVALDNAGPRIGPDILAATHTDLGAVLVNQGRLVEAEAELRKAMSLNRFYPEVHYQFGRVFIARGEIDRGIQAFENALKLDPTHSKARQALQAAATE